MHKEDLQPLTVLTPPAAAGARIVLCGVPGVTIDASGSLDLCEERLGKELDRLLTMRVKLLVSFVEDEELAPVAFEDIVDLANARGIDVIRFPIPDFGTPCAAQMQAWQSICARGCDLLAGGDSIAFHCLAGIGRSCMMAGNLLVQLGMPGPAALQLIRRSQPNGVETEKQLQFLLHGQRQT